VVDFFYGCLFSVVVDGRLRLRLDFGYFCLVLLVWVLFEFFCGVLTS
jgi:hypothetical protein